MPAACDAFVELDRGDRVRHARFERRVGGDVADGRCRSTAAARPHRSISFEAAGAERTRIERCRAQARQLDLEPPASAARQ
jgi:predicted dienelactone hydrolase